MIEPNIKNFVKTLLDKSVNKNICLIGHFDTDGITSTSIISQTLKRLGKQFSVKIVKQLFPEDLKTIPKGDIIILVDLGSGSLDELAQFKHTIFIIDHHEIKSPTSFPNIHMFNPHLLEEKYELCSAELSYLISKEINEENKNLAHLAILGMVGDTMEKNINKIRNKIIEDANVKVKKGILLYPSTRPLDKALEYCSRPFIPGITGNRENILELLKDAKVEKIGKAYKALIDLTETEMKSLATSLMLRMSSKEYEEHLGNLFLIKFFNKIEDARELSAIINACSRMNRPDIALMFCLGNSESRKKAEKIHVKYRQHIISGLKYIEKNGNIKGKEYIIINTKNNVKDTIIGTLASILSFSSVYEKGTIIIAMAYNEDRIKVSARIVGKNNTSRNLRQLLETITNSLNDAQSGGHQHAAGCTIKIEDQDKFIELLKKKLEFETIKI